MTIFADNDLVTAWSDRTNSVTLPALGGEEPTYKTGIQNGHATVRFAGAEGFEGTNIISDMVGVSGFSVFVVASIVTGVNVFRSYVATDSSGSRDFILGTNGSSSANMFDSENNNARRFGATNPGTTVHVIAGIYDGTAGPSQDLYLDGVLDNGSNTTIPATITMQGIALYIGKAGHANRYLTGDIYEVVFYEQTLSPADQLSVTNYLKTRYNIP